MRHFVDSRGSQDYSSGGKGFYTQAVDDAPAEIERLPGKHLYFLDDHLFGNVPFASALFDGMKGMGRLWQAAGTALYARMAEQGRLLHHNWDLYDTRHTVFKPTRMTATVLENGYWQAYHDFYRWGSIWRGAMTKADGPGRLRHIAYAGGWKKFEPLWDMAIRLKQVGYSRPLLEKILSGFGSN